MKVEARNWVGAPDRLVLLPEGKAGFVEVKAPGQVPRPLQLARHRQLRRLGYYVATLDSPDEIETVLDSISGGDPGAG